MPSGALTIHGGSGSDTINFAFTVIGTQTLAHATTFADTVNSLLSGGDSITQVSPFGGAESNAPASSTPIYVLEPSKVQGSSQAFIIAKAGYVVDSIGGALTIGGAVAGGDTVLVAGINSATTFNAYGANNEVIFVDGNNTYNGANSTGGDTVVAGSGFDSITTGADSTTVFSGTGDATITLNDTGSAVYNDKVWLNDGHATVYANGTGDAVGATTAGETVIGGYTGTSASYLSVALLPNSDGTANGNDLVVASATGSTTTAVFDYSANNTVDGGSGILYFIGGAGSADVVAGSGNAYLFGGSNGDVTLSGGTGLDYFVAGGGNETLDGASATGHLYLFGGDSTSADSFTGGSGQNLLVAGGGSETLAGGTGVNTFLLDAASTATSTITIADFGTNSTLDLSGFSQADVQTLLSGGTETNGNYVVKLSNGVSVTFDGLTGGSALNGHIVQF